MFWARKLKLSRFYIYIQSTWKIARWWYQLTYLHIHIDCSSIVCWKLRKFKFSCLPYFLSNLHQIFTILFEMFLLFLLNCLNLILTGGGGGQFDPPARNLRLPRDRRRSRHAFSLLFSFKSCASFDNKFAKIGPSVARSRDVLYSHVGTILPKICILHRFVYKTHGNYWFS